MKIKNKKVKEIKNVILLALIICLIIYIIYELVELISSPTEAVLVRKGEVSKEESTFGYIIREEEIITNQSAGENIEKLKAEGEKVSKGEAILKYYTVEKELIAQEISETEAEIQQALESQNEIFSSDIKALDAQIEDKLYSISNKNNVQELKENKTDINSYITKKAKITGDLSPAGSYIKDLILKKNELEESLLEGSQSIYASTSGIISYRIDDLENVLKTTNLESITKEMLNKLDLKPGKVISTSNQRVKLVNNFYCLIATQSSSNEAKNAKVGDKVNIKLSTGDEVKATIEHINDEENSRILIFRIIQNVEQLVSFRKISMDIIWWSASGLKIPNSSIIYKEGLSYILKKENNKDKEVLVKIIKENDEYSIVKNYNTDELVELGFDEETIRNLNKIEEYDNIIINPNIKNVTERLQKN
ncbi:MAG: HlyD family efflux transporter periplasmic adaptor subunit [Clostridia bacterium]